MARHSHWAQIKLKKGAHDKKRGKIFSKHAHLIAVAARSGSDPNMNAALRLAIDNARGDNMPRENIERAIKKGIGELKGEAEIEEITYEGFGPGGVALMIETLTDNKNRTSQTIRNILQESGGSLGGPGSTSFLFETKGVVIIEQKASPEADELEIIDAGALDIEAIDAGFIVYTASNELMNVKKQLETKGFTVRSAELRKIPKNTVEISDPAALKKVLELVDMLEEEEDVSEVVGNFIV